MSPRRLVAFLDPVRNSTTVESCAVTTGAVVVTGTITNETTTTKDYTLYAVFSSPPNLADAVADVVDVGPGRDARHRTPAIGGRRRRLQCPAGRSGSDPVRCEPWSA